MIRDTSHWRRTLKKSPARCARFLRKLSDKHGLTASEGVHRVEALLVARRRKRLEELCQGCVSYKLLAPMVPLISLNAKFQSPLEDRCALKSKPAASATAMCW